jgi:hypothetical protein
VTHDPLPPGSEIQQLQYIPVNAPPPPRKRFRLWIVLGAVMATVVVLLGVGAFVAVRNHNRGPGTAVSVPAWQSGGGKALTTKLIIDSAQAVAVPGLAQQSAACTHLQSDVVAAQAYLRIPDQMAQSNWEQALSYYAPGAQDCVTAIDKGDDALLSRANHEMLHGGVVFGAYMKRMDQLTGSAV